MQVSGSNGSVVIELNCKLVHYFLVRQGSLVKLVKARAREAITGSREQCVPTVLANALVGQQSKNSNYG